LWSTFEPYGDPLSSLSHGGEKIASHDIVWDAFVFIMRDAGFHILCEQTHVLLPPTLQFTCWWIDIMDSMDGVQMLVDIIINPI
jgi:hypothetical protein